MQKKNSIKLDITINSGQKIIPEGKEIIPGQPWATRDEAAHPLQLKHQEKQPAKWWHKYIGWFIWFS